MMKKRMKRTWRVGAQGASAGTPCATAPRCRCSHTCPARAAGSSGGQGALANTQHHMCAFGRWFEGCSLRAHVFVKSPANQEGPMRLSQQVNRDLQPSIQPTHMLSGAELQALLCGEASWHSDVVQDQRPTAQGQAARRAPCLLWQVV